MHNTIDNWADDRLAPDLRDVTRQAVNDNHVRHRPALVPANDNAPRPGRHPLIEYDADGYVIRALRRPVRNPLGCRPHQSKPGRLTPIGTTHAMMTRAAVDEWRRHAPANDSDIFTRRPRNKPEGQSDMADCVGDLLLWRSLTGGPLPDWAGAIIEAAANENEAEREKEEIRPTPNEVMHSMPEPVGERHWVRGGNRFWRHLWHDEDVEFRHGRIARLGGLVFSTATRRAPEDVERASNLAGPARDMPRAATLLKYNPKGKGWRLVTEHARERRAGVVAATNRNMRRLLGDVQAPGSPVVGKLRRPKFESDKERFAHAQETKALRQRVRRDFHTGSLDELRALHGAGTAFGAGLPAGPSNLRQLFLAGVSVGKDMSDGEDFSRVRKPVPVEIILDDNIDGAALLAAFHDAEGEAASVLDTAMTAQSYGDIAETVGKASPRTGKSALRRACETFRDFRLRFSATHAA